METNSQQMIRPLNDFDRIRLEFIAEHEDGKRPTLDAFAARYPQYAGELTDFILDYVRTENALARRDASDAAQGISHDEPAPYAVSVLERTLAALGIVRQGSVEDTSTAPPVAPELASPNPPVKTLKELRKERNLSPREMARRMLLNNEILMKLEDGRISGWSIPNESRLTLKLAETLSIPPNYAASVLRATVLSRHPVSLTAAFSADGNPDTTAVAKNRQAESFEDALAAEIAKGSLTADQRANWED